MAMRMDDSDDAMSDGELAITLMENNTTTAHRPSSGGEGPAKRKRVESGTSMMPGTDALAHTAGPSSSLGTATAHVSNGSVLSSPVQTRASSVPPVTLTLANQNSLASSAATALTTQNPTNQGSQSTPAAAATQAAAGATIQQVQPQAGQPHTTAPATQAVQPPHAPATAAIPQAIAGEPAAQDQPVQPADLDIFPPKAEWDGTLRVPRASQNNPHHKVTQEGMAPAILPNAAALFNKQPLPRIIINIDALCGNVAESQVKFLKETEDSTLVLSLFGGGTAAFRHLPNVAETIRTFIASFGVPMGSARIHIGEAASLKQAKEGPFAKPWVLFLANPPPLVREILLYYQTFAVDEEVAFSALSARQTLDDHPWVMLTFSGPYVMNDADAMRQALYVVRRTLFDHLPFRLYVHRQLVQEAGQEGTIDEHTLYMLKSLDITFVSYTLSGPTRVVNAWQITGQPISPKWESQQHYLSLVRKLTYADGFNRMRSYRAWNSCEYCKNEDHPMEACTIAGADDWMGPRPNLALTSPIIAGNPVLIPGPIHFGGRGHRGRGFGSRGGRGARGGRGRGRGYGYPYDR